MTDTPAAPTTQAGRTLRAFACWEFHAFDPNAHNASCGRVHELADGIEAEARATPAEALNRLLDIYDALDPFVTLTSDTNEARMAYEHWIDAISEARAKEDR